MLQTRSDFSAFKNGVSVSPKTKSVLSKLYLSTLVFWIVVACGSTLYIGVATVHDVIQKGRAEDCAGDIRQGESLRRIGKKGTEKLEDITEAELDAVLMLPPDPAIDLAVEAKCNVEVLHVGEFLRNDWIISVQLNKPVTSDVLNLFYLSLVPWFLVGLLICTKKWIAWLFK